MKRTSTFARNGNVFKAISWLIRGLLAVFVVFHVYALSLRFLPAPGSMLMAQQAVSGTTVRRDWKPIDKISPHLVRAVIAAEDSRFCTHDGIDFEAVSQAIEEKERGGRQRGASTITQQTAKNAFLWNGGAWVRKGAEAWLAVFIDFAWGKRRVMEEYLNLAEWGDGHFGAEAAAWARFRKPASALTERDAALLAAVLPSPNKWRLDPPGPYVTRRAGTIRARMRVIESESLAACVLG